jgi:hypothetical protein
MEVSGQLHTPAALSPRYPLYKGLSGPQSQSGCCGVQKIRLPCRESNPGRPARSSLLYRLTLCLHFLTFPDSFVCIEILIDIKMGNYTVLKYFYAQCLLIQIYIIWKLSVINLKIPHPYRGFTSSISCLNRILFEKLLIAQLGSGIPLPLLLNPVFVTVCTRASYLIV